jgi:hypothetical protein
MQEAGAQFLDVRDPAEYGKGHLGGASILVSEGNMRPGLARYSIGPSRSSSLLNPAASWKLRCGSAALASIMSKAISHWPCKRSRTDRTWYGEQSASAHRSWQKSWRAQIPRCFWMYGIRPNGAPGIMWLAKDLRKTGQSLFLPFRDQIRIDMIQLGQFRNCLLRQHPSDHIR